MEIRVVNTADDSEHFLAVMREVMAGAKVIETGEPNGPTVVRPAAKEQAS